MSDTGLISALGAARASIGAAIGCSVAANLLILAAPFYAASAVHTIAVQSGWGGLAVLCLVGVATLGALAMADEARERLMARIATFFVWHLAPGRDVAGGDLGGLRRAIGGPLATALLDLPWIPLFLAAAFLIHPVLGAAAAAGTTLVLLLGVAAHRWDQNPHAERAGRAAQTIIQVVTLSAGAVLLLAGEIGIWAGMAALILVRRTMAPVQTISGNWRELADAYRSLASASAERAGNRSELAGLPATTSAG